MFILTTSLLGSRGIVVINTRACRPGDEFDFSSGRNKKNSNKLPHFPSRISPKLAPGNGNGQEKINLVGVISTTSPTEWRFDFAIMNVSVICQKRLRCGAGHLYIVYGEPIALKKNIEGAPRIQYSSSYENDTYFSMYIVCIYSMYTTIHTIHTRLFFKNQLWSFGVPYFQIKTNPAWKSSKVNLFRCRLYIDHIINFFVCREALFSQPRD